jgi:hypothetical protein
MGFVDDQENGLAYLFFGLDEGLLDLLVDSTFGDSVTEAYQAVDVTQKIGAAQGGKRGIESSVEIVIEAIDKPAQCDGFAHAGVSGQQHDTASLLDMIEPCGAFLQRLGIEHIAGFDGFVKRQPLHAEPV